MTDEQLRDIEERRSKTRHYDVGSHRRVSIPPDKTVLALISEIRRLRMNPTSGYEAADNGDLPAKNRTPERVDKWIDDTKAIMKKPDGLWPHYAASMMFLMVPELEKTRAEVRGLRAMMPHIGKTCKFLKILFRNEPPFCGIKDESGVALNRCLPLNECPNCKWELNLAQAAPQLAARNRH